MVSCIFTCTNDLDAEFPAVAARDMGLSAVPLLCATRDRRARALCQESSGSSFTAMRTRRPSQGTSTCAMRNSSAATSRAPSDGPRVQRPRERDPGLPGGVDLRVRRRAREARVERDAVLPAPAGARGGGGAAADSQPLPGPGQVRPSPPSFRPHGRRRRADRHRQRLLRAAPRRRPRRCSSPAPRWSTPGPRSRSTRTSPRCRAPAPSTVAAERGRRARPRRDGERGHRRHPDGDRLQPEQPDRHGAAPGGDGRVPQCRPPQRGGDPRRGLRRVLRRSRTPTSRSTC